MNDEDGVIVFGNWGLVSLPMDGDFIGVVGLFFGQRNRLFHRQPHAAAEPGGGRKPKSSPGAEDRREF